MALASAIGSRQLRRLERIADQPARGRGALDLGDQPDPAVGHGVAQRAGEVARGGRMLGEALELELREVGRARAHLLLLVGEDAGEDVRDALPRGRG